MPVKNNSFLFHFHLSFSLFDVRQGFDIFSDMNVELYCSLLRQQIHYLKDFIFFVYSFWICSLCLDWMIHLDFYILAGVVFLFCFFVFCCFFFCFYSFFSPKRFDSFLFSISSHVRISAFIFYFFGANKSAFIS